MKPRATLQCLIPASLASLLLLSASIQANPSASAKKTPQVTPKEFTSGVRDFIEAMAKKHGFEKNSLTAVMSKAKYRQEVIDSMNRPFEAKPWHVYRPIFISDERIKGGVKFWNNNAKLLEKAEKVYGVPPQIIVATIGVETKYGQFMGKHLVLDSLSTLAFTYPKREKLFRKQLEAYMLLLSEESIDPEKAIGSYAGAIGKPQFIPGSYRAYAIDFDGDGRRDLSNSNADAIGSVANYYRIHGWLKGGAVASPATVNGPGYQEYLNDELGTTASIWDLSMAGVKTGSKLSTTTRCNLIQFDAGNKKEFWLGFHNFYVITKYNHNNQYAMAVYQLSQKILNKRNALNNKNG